MMGRFGGRYPPWIHTGEAACSAVDVTHDFSGEAAA